MNNTTLELISKTIVRLEAALEVNKNLGDLEKESIKLAILHLKNAFAVSQEVELP